MAPAAAAVADPQEAAARRMRWIGAGLLNWLSETLPAPSDIAAEIHALADRHDGRPARGAAHELSQAGVAPRQAALLRGCIRSLGA